MSPRLRQPLARSFRAAGGPALLVVLALGGCGAPRGLTPGPSPLGVQARTAAPVESISPAMLALAAQAAQRRWASMEAGGDAGQLARVSRIMSRLLMVAPAVEPQSPLPEGAVRLLRGGDPQAWCLPGGSCALTRELVAAIGDHDDWLAAVLAHDIAHLLIDHPRERLAQARVGGSADDAVTLLELPFHRVHEVEADRVSVELLARAGFDPGAAAAFWRMVEADPQPWARYRARHPGHDARIADLERYAVRLQPLVRTTGGDR